MADITQSFTACHRSKKKKEKKKENTTLYLGLLNWLRTRVSGEAEADGR